MTGEGVPLGVCVHLHLGTPKSSQTPTPPTPIFLGVLRKIFSQKAKHLKFGFMMCLILGVHPLFGCPFHFFQNILLKITNKLRPFNF